ncbi:MAG: alpha/beta fold hydrolase [Candidatus Hydrogenedens sp.]|nr:alpha/beta fold hydrolase [Candidatus Hydrogenedens sp.]
MSESPAPGILRTPDACFENLPGYAFAPHYLDIDGLRFHYLDEGPADAPPVLLIHGEPSWCYLYRKMIPGIVAAGFRAIAPDLMGFGRSDKPAERSAHTYARHVAQMTELVVRLDLQNATLFCQDWGGLIGLRVLANEPDRFARAIAANTALPDGPLDDGLVLVDEAGNINEAMVGTLPGAFKQWLIASQTMPVFNSGLVVQSGTVSDLPDDIVAAYNAPFPDESYTAGPRAMPTLVASQLASNARAWNDVYAHWTKPFLTAFSDSDPILGRNYKVFQERIPGAQGQPHVTIEQAGHFLQEDQGERLAEEVVAFARAGG